MRLFSRQEARRRRFPAAESELLAEMPARLLEVSRAAQAASETLGGHVEAAASRRFGEKRSAVDLIHDELARDLLERMATMRDEARRMATVLERAGGQLAILRAGPDLDQESAGAEPAARDSAIAAEADEGVVARR